MSEKKIKLWKRIWWSLFMRDRLIALGMRRPIRIKDEDYNVPKLKLEDLEYEPIPESVACLPVDCVIARDPVKWRQLAVLCLEKAKLCLCLSHILSTQYSVINNNPGMEPDKTTMLLLPRKPSAGKDEVQACDDELKEWVRELPDEACYSEIYSGSASIDLNLGLLHMVFCATLSALHRPLVFAASTQLSTHRLDSATLENSRRDVRRAATTITRTSQRLDDLGLVRYLPSTGVTVLLPAIIIHLLEIKTAADDAARMTGLQGFSTCIQIMTKLRDMYNAADFSIAFLEAAIRNAGIQIGPRTSEPSGTTSHARGVDDLVCAERRLNLSRQARPTSHHRSLGVSPAQRHAPTPPPEDSGFEARTNRHPVSDDEVARRLESFLADTSPPASDCVGSDHGLDHHHHRQRQQTSQLHDRAPPLEHRPLVTAPLSYSNGRDRKTGPIDANFVPHDSAFDRRGDEDDGFGVLHAALDFGADMAVGIEFDTDFEALIDLEGAAGGLGFGDAQIVVG